MAYPPLILGFPDFPKLQNEAPEQNQPGIRLCFHASVLDILIAKASVWIERGIMNRGAGSGFGSIDWQGPEIFLPIRMSLPERTDAIRVWRFSSGGEEPQVQIRAR